jgi:hypothetical protein
MKLALYTVYCGPNDQSTIKTYPVKSRYPHYLISNNENFLDTISKSFNYIPIFLDVPLSVDPIVSVKQSKIAKILPHRFKELREYDYLLYHDDKILLDVFDVEKIVRNMEAGDSPIGMRLHPSAPYPNVLFDFAESMYQWRYRSDWETLVSYISEQVASGYKLQLDQYFATGVVLRNMKHKDLIPLSELWYDHTFKSSAVCQISFHFARQRFENVMVLPENIVNHWF